MPDCDGPRLPAGAAGAALTLLGLPLLLAAVVAVADLALARCDCPVVVLGLLDEPAHLATAALGLLLVHLARPLTRRTLLVALVASVAIDADHVPLYAGVPGVAPDGGRPVSHSLLTVALLAAVALLLPRRHPAGGALRRPSRVPLRSDALAAAAGVALHLVRDTATGPGAPLLWPLRDESLSVPYAAYGTAVATAAALATAAIAVRRSRVRR